MRPIWRPSSRARRACTDPLDDQIPFQFGDRSDDDNDGTAERPASIYIFPEAYELNINMVELVEHFQKVPGGACDPVEGPDHEYVELAAAGIGQELVKTRALRFRPADPVSVFLDNLEATLRRS